MNKSVEPVWIVGGGGHARVVHDVLGMLGVSVLGFVLPETSSPTSLPLPVISDAELLRLLPSGIRLANGVGAVDHPSLRAEIYQRIVTQGFHFRSLAHPAAVIEPSAILGEGVQVMAGAVVQGRVRLGRNVLVNTRAVVEHDCRVGDHSHIASGAVLAGGVTVGARCLIGAGAIIKQGVVVGDDAVVGAGAVVLGNVPQGGRVAGVPAQPIRTSS